MTHGEVASVGWCVILSMSSASRRIRSEVALQYNSEAHVRSSLRTFILLQMGSASRADVLHTFLPRATSIEPSTRAFGDSLTKRLRSDSQADQNTYSMSRLADASFCGCQGPRERSRTVFSPTNNALYCCSLLSLLLFPFLPCFF